jgi:hypothetical protein
MATVKLGDRRVDFFGSWSRSATVDGRVFRCFVTRGRAVRIAFKPRGFNRGYQWDGSVYDQDGRRIWAGAVTGTIGVRGLLRLAGVI